MQICSTIRAASQTKPRKLTAFFSYRVTWDKEQRAKAKETRQALFAFGMDSSIRVEMGGLCSPELAGQLFKFVLAITRNKAPAEAFEDAFSAKTKPEDAA